VAVGGSGESAESAASAANLPRLAPPSHKTCPITLWPPPQQVAEFQRQQRARDVVAEADYLRHHPVDVQVGHRVYEDMPQEVRARFYHVLATRPDLAAPLKVCGWCVCGVWCVCGWWWWCRIWLLMQLSSSAAGQCSRSNHLCSSPMHPLCTTRIIHTRTLHQEQSVPGVSSGGPEHVSVKRPAAGGGGAGGGAEAGGDPAAAQAVGAAQPTSAQEQLGEGGEEETAAPGPESNTDAAAGGADEAAACDARSTNTADPPPAAPAAADTQPPTAPNPWHASRDDGDSDDSSGSGRGGGGGGDGGDDGDEEVKPAKAFPLLPSDTSALNPQAGRSITAPDATAHSHHADAAAPSHPLASLFEVSDEWEVLTREAVGGAVGDSGAVEAVETVRTLVQSLLESGACAVIDVWGCGD